MEAVSAASSRNQLETILCAKCGIALEPVKTTGSYLGFKFPVELFGCKACGKVYVPETLVRTKIAEVEKLLEEK